MSIVGKKYDSLGNCYDLNVGNSTLDLIIIFTSGRMVIIYEIAKVYNLNIMKLGGKKG